MSPAQLPVMSWGADAAGWAILVHGGAGQVAVIHQAEHAAGCLRAARAGAELLRGGGMALDAVERAVAALEDDPLFNAGTGACLNADGNLELDAAIMEGTELRAGAVCALPAFRNPIAIARAALEDGRHVFYAGEGAACFAAERGFARSTADAMTTAAARADWERARSGSQGTVGAVARDTGGRVAAATSTGGLLRKHPGRVGDSPVLGAGNYADDAAGACSATGLGEAILRLGSARSAIEAMRAGFHPEEAARGVIRALGDRMNAAAGCILVDHKGRLGFARNTPTMAWAALSSGALELAGT